MITLLEVRNAHLDLSRTAFPPVANGFVIHVTADVTHVSKELSCEGKHGERKAPYFAVYWFL